MSSYRDSCLDNLVRASLERALWQKEPSPNAWRRIESRLQTLDALPGLSSVQRFSVGLQRVVRLLGNLLFAMPAWHGRLTESKLQLVTQIAGCPGSDYFSLAIVV